MRHWLREGALACAGAATAFLVACDGKSGRGGDDDGPVVGGGERKITHITVRVVRIRVKVGEHVHLTVHATWGIPYVEEVTDAATFEVLEEGMGELVRPDGAVPEPGPEPGRESGKSVFIPKRTGRATIRARFLDFADDIVLRVRE